ncbi:hypothetical protein OH76DRAFT_1557268 [Lentinus brumalis]|uniref:Uncharacterized protein n=1 Tax=Lentinus brumalis TaxID=2498619 RepID=A0A371D6L4_9APHY|nr:hypothetical protein OH76DRAFT_1557268 [Polyporus brumalis]
MQPDMNVSAFFLPRHRRLGSANRPEYKYTIETVCRSIGIDDHLNPEPLVGEWPSTFRATVSRAGKDVPAHTVWAHLVKIHEPRFTGLRKRVRSLTRLGWALLGLIMQARPLATLQYWMQKSLPSEPVRSAKDLYFTPGRAEYGRYTI